MHIFKRHFHFYNVHVQCFREIVALYVHVYVHVHVHVYYVLAMDKRIVNPCLHRQSTGLYDFICSFP